MPLLTLIIFLTFAGFCFAQTSPLPTTTSASGIEGAIVVGPTHPGPVRPGIASTSPLSNSAFVVSKETGAIAEFTTDAQGRFKVSVQPGHYTVVKKGPQNVGRCGPFVVDVNAGQMTKVEWHCDTGMR